MLRKIHLMIVLFIAIFLLSETSYSASCTINPPNSCDMTDFGKSIQYNCNPASSSRHDGRGITVTCPTQLSVDLYDQANIATTIDGKEIRFFCPMGWQISEKTAFCSDLIGHHKPKR